MLRALLVPKNGWYEVKQKRVFSEKAHGAKAIQGHPIHKFIFCVMFKFLVLVIKLLKNCSIFYTKVIWVEFA